MSLELAYESGSTYFYRIFREDDSVSGIAESIPFQSLDGNKRLNINIMKLLKSCIRLYGKFALL